MNRLLIGAMFAAVTVPVGLLAADCEGIDTTDGERIELALVHPLLNRPVAVAAPNGDTERIFVVEQRGLVRIVRLTDGNLLSTPFLTLSSRVSQTGDWAGLLGIAFHPNYESNGYFYVHYTFGATGASVISRFEASDDPDVADATSEFSLFSVEQPSTANNGGGMAFGPDGFLYVGFGDGGEPGDPTSNAQNPQSLLGKILRIDVDATEEGRNYGIPADNPFVEGDSARPEIWALGVRNPWRLTFDDETGDLYFGDHGGTTRHEINYLSPADRTGQNFEWRRKEGTRVVNEGSPLTIGFAREPVFEYPLTSAEGIDGCAVIGGLVYRGCAMPDLHGTYFYADLCGDWIRSFRLENGEITHQRDRTTELNSSIALNPVSGILGFGTDGRGEIYVCDSTGKLFRIEPRDTNLPPSAAIHTTPAPPRVLLVDGTAEITLDASDSDDGDGGIQELTATWTKLSGPAGDSILAPESATTVVQFTAPGNYAYEVTVDDGEATDSADIEILVVESSDVQFRRADSNTDGGVDISDGVSTLQFLFLGASISCPDAADANDSGDLDLTDAVFTFNYLFLGGGPPPAPGPIDCGPDDTGDLLEECESMDACP